MQSRFVAVPEALRQHVECIRVFSHSGETGAAIHVAPSATPGITFHHQNGRPALAHIRISGRTIAPPTLFLYGPGTAPSVMHYKGGQHNTILVMLKPHALRSLFGLNTATLTNSNVDLYELARENIAARMMDAGDTDRQARLLTDFLISRLAAGRTQRDLLVEEALQLIHASAVSVTVKALLAHLNLSERQFERRFLQTTGITPQTYIRIKRFHEAVRCIAGGQHQRLTDIAHALNYYDQSHFIRDVKMFSGITPKDLRRIEEIDHHPQAGTSWLER